MKKVVISKFKRWFLFSAFRCCLRGVFDFAEHVQSEELALVGRVVTKDISFGDLTALDELRQTEQLAELASQIDFVALVGYEVDIAFASVKHA